MSDAFSGAYLFLERLAQQFQEHLVTNIGVGKLGFSVRSVHDQVQMVDVGQSWVGWVTPRLCIKMKAKSEVRLQGVGDAPRSFVNLSHPVKKAFRLPSDRVFFFRVGRAV